MKSEYSKRSPFALVAVLVLLGGSICAQNYRFGIVTQELSPDEADAVAHVGIGWVLLNFNWDQVDRRCTSAADLPRCRDYASLDAMVDAAAARGLEVLADLSYTAAWANGTGWKQSPPLDLHDYYDYVFDMVARYSPRVKVWKLWNEPNLSAFLAPADAWMLQYKTYVTWAHAAIKNADPTALIAGPDLSYHALTGGALGEFKQIMDDYGWWAFDIVSIHHYDDDAVPLGVRLDEDVRAARLGKPVWITETGQRWQTEGQTFETQRNYYLRALTDSDDRREWVTNLFFYQLVGGDFFNVTQDGSYGRAFPALRSYEQWIQLGRDRAFELAGVPAEDAGRGAIDRSIWTPGMLGTQPDRRVPVAQFGTQIHIGDFPTGVAQANGVVSAHEFSLDASAAAVRVRTPPAPDTSVAAMFVVAADSKNYYGARIQSGRILFEAAHAGVRVALGAVPFSLVGTAWLRIRHDAATDEIVFETAASDHLQTVRARIPRRLDVAAVRIALSAGTTSAEAAAGTVVFDRVMFP